MYVLRFAKDYNIQNGALVVYDVRSKVFYEVVYIFVADVKIARKEMKCNKDLLNASNTLSLMF